MVFRSAPAGERMQECPRQNSLKRFPFQLARQLLSRISQRDRSAAETVDVCIKINKFVLQPGCTSFNVTDASTTGIHFSRTYLPLTNKVLH